MADLSLGGLPPIDLTNAGSEVDPAHVCSEWNAERRCVQCGKGRRGRKPGSKNPPKQQGATGDVAQLIGSDDEARAVVKELTEEITSPEQLADVLCATFAIPGVLVDESFNLEGPDGKPSKRCMIAARRLYPCVKKYGTQNLAKWLPEILAVWGIIELAKPCVGPVIEIAAGVRQPLMFRAPELPEKSAAVASPDSVSDSPTDK